jgi:hypothetical protein
MSSVACIHTRSLSVPTPRISNSFNFIFYPCNSDACCRPRKYPGADAASADKNQVITAKLQSGPGVGAARWVSLQCRSRAPDFRRSRFTIDKRALQNAMLSSDLRTLDALISSGRAHYSNYWRAFVHVTRNIFKCTPLVVRNQYPLMADHDPAVPL